MSFRLSILSKHTLIYGVSLAALLFLLQWLHIRYLLMEQAMDIYIGAIAIIFTALGIWLAVKLVKPKTETIIVEKEIYVDVPGPLPHVNGNFVVNEKALDRSGISSRELEVLHLMATGLSNQEIAAQLFVSLNTVKTHSSNLFMKLDVNRRMQAVEKARKLGIIP